MAELLYAADPTRARAWLGRIRPEDRASLPALALYEAREALARGASPDEFRALYARLVRFRDTPEGRAYPRVDETLAEIAGAVSRPKLARVHRDLDFRTRSRRAQPFLRDLESALEGGALSAARDALAKAELLAPASLELAELRMRLALVADDLEGFRRAVAVLRRIAGSPSAAIALENRLRAEHGLPLLPRLAPELLVGSAPAPPTD